MNIPKAVVKQVFSVLGYQIIRTSIDSQPIESAFKKEWLERLDQLVPFDNFRNLALAYEAVLNQIRGKIIIEPNLLRTKLLARLLGTQPIEAYFIIEALANTRTVPGD